MAITLKQHSDLKNAVTLHSDEDQNYLKQLERNIIRQNRKTKAINRKRRNIKY